MTDLHTVAKEIHEKGSILVGSLKAQTYLNSLQSGTNSLCKVSDAEIIDNYKSFLKKIELYLKDKVIGSLSS